ncbi:MAG: MATE family efflux transporter [Planctomycetota bacterium]|nr:MATE family efflux transporter [Planctomycetota bacterium]
MIDSTNSDPESRDRQTDKSDSRDSVAIPQPDPRTREELHPPGSLAELLSISVPLIISAGSFTINNVIDRVYLSWYSREALAASLNGSMFHWTLLAVPIGVCMYANTFVAQYDGAGRKGRVSASVWQAVYLAVFTGLVLMALNEPAVQILAWTTESHDRTVSLLQIEYFQALNIGSPIFLATATLSTFFSGRGRTRPVMVVNIIAMLFNCVGNYALIFGAGFIPSLGITGAGYATVLSRLLALGLFLALILRREEADYHFFRHYRLDWKLLGRMAKYGLPAGWQLLADVGGFTVFLFLIGGLGANEMASTTLAFNINSVAFIPLLGVGMGVSTIVGRRIGEGRPELAVQTTWKSFWMTIIWVVSLAAFYLSVPEILIDQYQGDHAPAEFAELRDSVVVLLRFVAVYTLFDAMAVVFSNAVRGAGDTRFALWFTFGSCWLLMVIPTWIARWPAGAPSRRISW